MSLPEWMRAFSNSNSPKWPCSGQSADYKVSTDPDKPFDMHMHGTGCNYFDRLMGPINKSAFHRKRTKLHRHLWEYIRSNTCSYNTTMYR